MQSAQVGSGGTVCGGCRNPIAAGIAVCPRCGRAAAGVATAVRGGAHRRLLLLLGLALVLMLAVRFTRTPAVSEQDCQGGQDASVTWEAGTEVKRARSKYLNAIDPGLTPHVRVAVVRHSGNAVYAHKSDNEYGHNHQPVIDRGHDQGGNGYFHAPARPLGDDRFEVETTIVVAHPGPISRAIKERHFSDGEVLQIFRVNPGSPAERAGLSVNDLVLAVDGRPAPRDPDAMLAIARAVPDNGTLRFEVLRAGAPQTIAMTRQGAEKFGFFAMRAPILDVTP